MSKQPVIVFDLGGVLIDWNPYHLYRKMFDSDEEIKQFIEETSILKWNEKQDEGRPFSEAVKLLSAQHPRYDKHIRAFHERWVEMISGEIKGTVEILAQLREQEYELHALSNWSAETYPFARSRFEFLTWFQEIVVSGYINLIKPDPRIFAHLLGKIEQKAEDCIYIDDSKVNFESAQKLGFQAIHFQSPEKLREELLQLGIELNNAEARTQ